MWGKPGPAESSDAWNRPWPRTPAEFDKLIDLYLERLFKYAFRRLGNPHDAEDVVQEVFVRAYTGRSKRKSTVPVGPYLYRMVGNACTDLQRKHKRSAVLLEKLRSAEASNPQWSGKDSLNRAEEMRWAERLLQRLPVRQAEAIRLRVFGELQLNEVAQVLGCSVNTVSSRLRYGFRKLRRIVSREMET